MSASPIERELLEAAHEIGLIADSASWFTAILANEIEVRGKPLADFTIAELLALYREQHDRAVGLLGSTKY